MVCLSYCSSEILLHVGIFYVLLSYSISRIFQLYLEKKKRYTMSTKKKAKRDRKKMKAPPPSIPSPFDLLMTELSLSSTTATTANSMCYHGSTAEKFSPGSDYRKAIQDFLSFDKVLVEEYNCLCFLGEFETKYPEELSQFLFAWSTHLFLNLDDEESRKMIELLFLFGIGIKYGESSHDNSETILKYDRDIRSGDRGIILCLARENYCDCMKQKKEEAKEMVKHLRCDGCKKIFPREQMRDCIGCKNFSFHSKECYKKHWREHKIICKRLADISKEVTTASQTNEDIERKKKNDPSI